LTWEASSTLTSNNIARSTSISGPSGAGNGVSDSDLPLTLQYGLNSPISTDYTSVTPDGWFPQQQPPPLQQDFYTMQQGNYHR